MVVFSVRFVSIGFDLAGSDLGLGVVVVLDLGLHRLG